MATETKIIKELDQQEGQAQKAEQRLEKEFDKLQRNYSAQVARYVQDPDTWGRTDTANLAVATKMAAEFPNILQEAGYPELVEKYIDQFPALTQGSLDYFKDFTDSIDLAGADQTTLKAWIEFTEGEIFDQTDSALVKPLQSAVFQGAFGQISRESVIEDVLSRTDKLTLHQATTLVDDSFRAYQRQVTVMKANELGLDLYIYLGPLDEKTSPQCQDMLAYDAHGAPGIAYKDEINASMVDGLRENPLVRGGHFNCRHKWMPIDVEDAKELGFQP